MISRKVVIPCVLIMSHVLLACNSLVSEADRVRKLYNLKNGPFPSVTATDPADNTLAPSNQTYIDITFSTVIDPGTITAQTAFGACSGSLQLSYDGFSNCLAGTLDFSQNPRIRFIPTIFPRGLGLQIKVTTQVLSPDGVPATLYISPIGFKLAAPCSGGQNCFFSFSTPLMKSAGTVSGAFLIRSGTHAGKYIVYSSSGQTTTMIDPVTATSVDGPPLTSCFTPGFKSYSFFVSSGPLKDKEIIVAGGSSTATCYYDPTTHTIVPTGTPNSPTLPPSGAGFGGMELPALPNGDRYLLRGAGNTNIYLYSAASGLISDASPLVTNGGVNTQTNAVAVQTGSHAGQYLIVQGVASSTTTWYDPAGPTFTAGPSVGVPNTGSSSFEARPDSGPAYILTVLGGNTVTTTAVDTTSLSSLASPPAVTGPVVGGGLILHQVNTATWDEPLILHGGTSAGSSKFNKATGTRGAFTAGPATTGAIRDGSSQIYAGGNNDAFLIVNGNGTPSTSVYFSASNTFHGSRLPTVVPDIGANSFPVAGGSHNGKTLIVGGNATAETALFDPLRFEMTQGPPLPGGITGTASSFNFTLTRGNHTGKTLVFIGGGTSNVAAFDPQSGIFSSTLASPALPAFATLTTGATAFPIENDNHIIIVRGGTAVADTLDQTTGTLVAAITPAPACASTVRGLAVRHLKAGAVRTLVYCSGNQWTIFDHTTQQFLGTLGALTGATAGAGIQAFVINQGINAGKIFVVHGNGQVNTSIYDPASDTSGPGPLLSVCGINATEINAASQLMPIFSGPNNGKHLLIAGGTTVKTCLIDSANNSVTTGPNVGPTGAEGFQITPGALAFRTGGGLYPTAFILLSGASKNVWSTYVP